MITVDIRRGGGASHSALSLVSQENKLHTNSESEETRPVFTMSTLCSDGIGHGARITQALAVDCSNHEQVDCVGTKTFDGELCGFDVICYCLPAVAHRLTVMKENDVYCVFIRCNIFVQPTGQ